MLMLSDPLQRWDRLFETTGGPTAAMDAFRLGDVVTLRFDLPGIEFDSIDLQIERGELRLSARRQSTLPEGATYLIHERADTTVTRRVMLGDVLDVEHVDAEFVDGVLTLRIPLHESAKPRRVNVRHVVDVARERDALSAHSA